MICKKCGHDVDKYEVTYGVDFVKTDKIKDKMKVFMAPYCPCGEKL